MTVFRKALVLCYALAFAVLVALLAYGWSFYATPLAERPHHEGYWRWKPGGSIGIPLGIAGSAMMTVMLLYSVRKRVKLLRKLGLLAHWLDLHIFLGIVGPLLIVLHSSFKVHGLVSLSFWSMVAVAASGILGRYLYLAIPRTRAGEELTLRELEKLDGNLSARLRSEFRLDDKQLARLEALASPADGGRGLLRGLLGLIVDDLRLRRRLHRFARQCPTVPRALLSNFKRVVREKAQVHGRIRVLSDLHALFHYWHVIHKPFATIMYLFMVVHIAVALLSGYGWS